MVGHREERIRGLGREEGRGRVDKENPQRHPEKMEERERERAGTDGEKGLWGLGPKNSVGRPERSQAIQCGVGSLVAPGWN